MSIAQYIKVIGRGKQGARALDRAQAADLFGQVLDGTVTDLEVGAFCLSMRIKGEEPQEMAGFLDATYARLNLVPTGSKPVVVLPSYNGARRLPVLTPLLAALVARRGWPVLIHGTSTETSRVFVENVLFALGTRAQTAIKPIADGEVAYVPTELLSPGLKRLLDVRRAVGLRNSSHSLVKLMNPCAGAAVIVSSYTHPEYAVSMAAVFELMGSTALLLRGTEGEVVADARRLPQMDGFIAGKRITLQEGQKGTLTDLPDLPTEIDPETTASYIQEVLAGTKPVPASMALQVEHILRLVQAS
ncbi:DNA-binding protein YbiB [Polaromonas sp. A23]|uniref:DNA-binding protein YbiB n=1 Tax=Polaromonas sp. A23 TaxID=1944133 RepID=UPI0009857007|nr:DNA-binding protein YbiB [Polaromonas sp. A23]OOG48259.1 DNA-binding protein YbiB [Polaromonas sp. A23]